MINLDDLTLGQLKEIKDLLINEKTDNKKHFSSVFIGKIVIVRTYSAGVHFGTLKEYDPTTATCILENSRRLWYIKNKGTGSVSETSKTGIINDSVKIDTAIQFQLIAEVIEILPCTESAIRSISEVPDYES